MQQLIILKPDMIVTGEIRTDNSRLFVSVDDNDKVIGSKFG